MVLKISDLVLDKKQIPSLIFSHFCYFKCKGKLMSEPT